jgi:hypothetical protein
MVWEELRCPATQTPSRRKHHKAEHSHSLVLLGAKNLFEYLLLLTPRASRIQILGDCLRGALLFSGTNAERHGH